MNDTLYDASYERDDTYPLNPSWIVTAKIRCTTNLWQTRVTKEAQAKSLVALINKEQGA